MPFAYSILSTSSCVMVEELWVRCDLPRPPRHDAREIWKSVFRHLRSTASRIHVGSVAIADLFLDDLLDCSELGLQVFELVDVQSWA